MAKIREYVLTVTVLEDNGEFIYSVIQEVNGRPEQVLAHGRADEYDKAFEEARDVVARL